MQIDEVISKFNYINDLKMYSYIPSSTTFDLPYDEKTNERIINDIENSYSNWEGTDTYAIHSLYPQCYILLWLFNDKKQPTLLFSEVMYTDDSLFGAPVICCQKCNRQINTRQFASRSLEAIIAIGNLFMNLYHQNIKTYSHTFLSRTILKNHACNLVTRSHLLDESIEIPQAFSLSSYAKELADLIIAEEVEKAKMLFQKMINQIMTPTEKLTVEKKLLTHVPTLISSLCYELSSRLPYMHESIFALMDTLLSEFMAKETFNDHIMFTQDMLTVFFNLFIPSYNKDIPHTIKKTLQIIHSHYSTNLKISNIASTIDVSVSYLSREFKNHMKMSFSKYLLDYRLKKAINLMIHTDTSLMDIALSVGFDSSSYFSTCFKKVFNLSPTDYMRQQLI